MAFSDGTADFRSDTVTRPTDEMRKAMAEAEVGDDVFGDDPTVNALEEEAAAALAKEAAVFTPSGTMGNQLAIQALTKPGEEVLCVADAHLRNVERGAGPAFAGIGFRTVVSEGGRITPDQITSVMEQAGRFHPRVRLMAWENTHNASGGRVVPTEVMQAGTVAARALGLSVHLDGARVFNAAVASGVEASAFAALADTVQFCFSKGLGAPIGSAVCGTADLVAEIRYLRRRMGGGMRQVGVIAAAARIALRDRDRIAEDHILSRYLGERLAGVAPGSVDLASVETNMVLVRIDRLPLTFEDWRDRLAVLGIKVYVPLGGYLRLVTHRDVDRGDVDRLVTALRSGSSKA